MDKVGKKLRKWKLTPPKVIRYGRVVLDTPLFRIWYSFVTKIKKEAPNRMKISHCIKVLHRVFPRIWPHLQTGFFPSAIWTPLGGCVRKVFGTILNNSKQVNASGTNSVKYFIYFATLIHLLVFVKKNITGKLISLLAC